MVHDNNKGELGAAGRRLIRGCGHAALGTTLAGRPYVSLVAAACDMDACPLLLLSDLAQHTKNLNRDPQISLLFGDTKGHADPLAGPRLTLLGQTERCDEPRTMARFTARHPSAASYAGFADFHLYRVVIERAHLVAGFGRIDWIEAAELGLGTDTAALAAAEPDVLDHMNRDHADMVELYARRLLSRPESGWQMTGIDPEGADLRAGAVTARLDFDTLVLTPTAARRALVALTQRAREMPGG